MKLAKAKEIIHLNIKEAGRQMPPDVLTALQIHVQAVDRLEVYRNRHPELIWELLPSETAE